MPESLDALTANFAFAVFSWREAFRAKKIHEGWIALATSHAVFPLCLLVDPKVSQRSQILVIDVVRRRIARERWLEPS